MKKVTALLLTLVMIASLAACGTKSANKPANNKSNQPATDNTAATEAPTEAVDTPTAAAENPTDLTMWCIATESDSNRHAYEAAIDDFKKAHPEINFTWEATENQAYKTKIKAAASANEMPDIFFTWGLGFLGEFVDSGRVYCLDDAYAKYKDQLTEVKTVNHTFDGKLYAAPMTFNIVAMFCNKDLLSQAGYTEAPKTYDDLIACCDALKAKGITPFGCSGKEAWCITEYLESIIEKNIGAAAFTDMYKGNASWNDPGVVKAVDLFEDMVKKEYFDAEGIALTNDEVKENFKNGKYAFYINGTWNCADFAQAGLEDKIQVAEFPVVDASKSQIGELIGGANDSLAVAAGSKNPELAAESVMELSKAICHYGYLDGNGLPAWTPDYDTSSLNKLTVAVADIVGNSTSTVLFGDNFLSAEAANIYLDYVSQAYACKIDGQKYAEGLDSDLK